MSTETLNKYKCFWRGKTAEVDAGTSLQAQLMAAKKLGARKSYEVTVMLLEKDGAPVAHSTGSL